MEELDFLCKNCGHAFKYHEQSHLNIWFCDYMNETGQYCDCNEFYHKATGADGDEIIVPYDSESYRWN